MWREHHLLGSKQITEACNSKWSLTLVGTSCSSFYVKEFDAIVHKTYFLYMNNPISKTANMSRRTCVVVKQMQSNPILSNAWPFCTPNHLPTWWLRWELGIVTRSYYISWSFPYFICFTRSGKDWNKIYWYLGMMPLLSHVNKYVIGRFMYRYCAGRVPDAFFKFLQIKNSELHEYRIGSGDYTDLL